MFKSLLTLALITWLMSSALAAPLLVLDLDKSVNSQLLPTSQYYVDSDELLDFSSAKNLDAAAWVPFQREQFQFGFTSGAVWVKTTFKTTGSKSRDIALKLHHSLDNQSLRVSSSDEATVFSFGMGMKPTHRHENHDESTSIKAKPDHVIVLLSPNKTYHLLLRSKSANPVISDFRAVDHETLLAECQVLDSWLYAYLLLALLVIIYSSSLLLVTRDSAYLYHMSYILSVMLYLLTDTGYITAWFELYDLQLLQRLTLLSLTSGLLSIMLLFRAVHADFNQYSPVIKTIYNSLINAGLLIALLMFVTSYELAVRLFTVNVSIALLMACYLLLKAPYNVIVKGFFEDYRSMIFRVTLLIFTPLVIVHLITRMGFIKVNWLTDYILFLSMFIETFLITGLLLLNMNQSKRAFQLEELTNNLSSLPNHLALERQFLKSDHPAPQTLLQVWVSGFDSLQTTLGPAKFRKFLVSFGHKAKQQISETTLLAHSQPSAEKNHPLFHSDLKTFVILCRSLNQEDQDTIVEIITTAINAAIDPYHEHFDFKVSIGAHIFESQQSDFETVIQKSMLTLSDGIKNDVPFNYYTENIGFNEARRNRLISDFYHSLNHGEFFLLWQPQFDTHKNTICGVEVLARWKHAEYGMVGPDEFIPLLEQSHRISALTKWVINTVFDKLPSLHQSAGKVEVSINLSTRDLSNNDLVELLDKKLISHADLVPYVTMEITESMMIDDYQVVLRNVNKLQQRGFKVSIDDFGSGYASYAYLQSLPADELKIDKCYTDRFEEPRTSAILESVIELAKNLNITTVVEGVESTQQIERFTQLGVDRLQGWALGKPMSLDDLIIKAS